jgi:hypothetical protein
VVGSGLLTLVQDVLDVVGGSSALLAQVVKKILLTTLFLHYDG